jgi:formate-dependent nitrite reductase membrane component NrfD
MPLPAQVEHFAGPPEWGWYIVFYFFFAGLSGGSYAIATLFRLRRGGADDPAARLGYYVALPTLLACPVLLILDLGAPLRFWHMVWNTTPGAEGFNFKYWSPMSVGVWALMVFSVCVLVSFVEALVRDGRIRWSLARRAVRPLDGTFGTMIAIVGGIFGLFIAGYTGVLLAVSNQPVWSDTWALGGLFLASGLSASAALLLFLLRYRPAAKASTGAFIASEQFYAALELALIVVFAVTLIPAGALDIAFGFPWLLLWLVALAGLAASLMAGAGDRPAERPAVTGPGASGPGASGPPVTGEGVVVPVRSVSAVSSVAVVGLVLLGVLALRAAVILSAQ